MVKKSDIKATIPTKTRTSDIVTAIAALSGEWGGPELLDTMIAGGIEGDPDALGVLSEALALRGELRAEREAKEELDMEETSFPITVDMDDEPVHPPAVLAGMSSSDLLDLCKPIVVKMAPGDLKLLRSIVTDLLGTDPKIKERALSGGYDLVLSTREKEWLQGVRTNENPRGDQKKINAIKSLRDRMRREHGYEMLLKDAKEYVEEYQALVRSGAILAMPSDQRNEWVKTGKLPEGIISEEIQRMLNTELPPWIHDDMIVSQYSEALTELERTLGWNTGEITTLAQEYLNRAGRSEFKILTPRPIPVVDESSIVDIHDDFMLEDE